jgi:hypothetical protein
MFAKVKHVSFFAFHSPLHLQPSEMSTSTIETVPICSSLYV